MLIGIIKFIVK